MKKLSVHLVTWNGAKYVPYLFDSLKKQTSTDWELFIWDNNSQDDMVECMKNEMIGFSVPVHMNQSEKNIGFAGGHNALFQQNNHEYLLLLNQDMYLEETCIADLLAYMEQHKQLAGVSPRLMRWDFAEVEKGEIENSFSEYIDALGLKLFKNGRVIEQYTQARWAEDSLESGVQKLFSQEATEVFGLSGALPLFRRSAIEQITFEDGTFFDEQYHSYKEDVDVAYRLKLQNYPTAIVLQSVAYHDRSAAGPQSLSDSAAKENKQAQSEWVKYHSYKNHLFTLYKNLSFSTFFRFSPRIKWYEFKKFVYFLFFDRSVISKGMKEMWKLRKDMKQKRISIQSKRSVSPTDMRRWFN